MFKHLIVLAYCASFLACAGTTPTPKLPKGKCIINEDCPQGTRCLEERCRDIYFPELDQRR